MKGARPLTDQEIQGVLNDLKTLRDKALLILGCKTGLRISEMLSLTWGDVMEHGSIGDYVTVQKKNTKGKIESKTLPLGPTIKEALRTYHESIRPIDLTQPLFKSTQSNKSITRAQAHNVLKDAFRSQKLTGNCSTHSCRKSYAQRIHKALGEKIEMTQVALCHRSLSSTQSYISVDREAVEKAIVGLG
jgi:site-specific recombinase XerD